MIKREREHERAQVGEVAGGGRSSLPAEQGALYRTWSPNPRVRTWAEGRRSVGWVTQASLVSGLKSSLCDRSIATPAFVASINTIDGPPLPHFQFGDVFKP